MLPPLATQRTGSVADYAGSSEGINHSTSCRFILHNLAAAGITRAQQLLIDDELILQPGSAVFAT
jgi:hypothetical protein